MSSKGASKSKSRPKAQDEPTAKNQKAAVAAAANVANTEKKQKMQTQNKQKLANEQNPKKNAAKNEKTNAPKKGAQSKNTKTKKSQQQSTGGPLKIMIKVMIYFLMLLSLIYFATKLFPAKMNDILKDISPKLVLVVDDTIRNFDNALASTKTKIMDLYNGQT